MKVGIVGVGITPFRPSTPEFSWKELMYDGAQRAYADAGIDPRTDVDSFITCAEDYYEGFGIFDEFTPDQLGAVLRPMHTVGGDGNFSAPACISDLSALRCLAHGVSDQCARPANKALPIA